MYIHSAHTYSIFLYSNSIVVHLESRTHTYMHTYLRARLGNHRDNGAAVDSSFNNLF